MVASIAAAVVGAVVGAVTNNVVAQVFKLGEKRCELWKGFPNDIEFFKRELLMIAAVEEDQISGNGAHQRAVEMVSMEEMRDLAHDIEDCLDRILRYTGEGEGEAPLLHRLRVVSPPLATEVKQLKDRLKAAHQRRVDYNVNDNNNPATSSTTSRVNTDTAWVEPVGIHEPKRELQEMLLMKEVEGQQEQLNVICIVGFSGSGKSTLAKALYDSPDVVQQFPCRAWVVASEHRGNSKGFLTALLENLRRGGDPAMGGLHQLQYDIRNYLNTKRGNIKGFLTALLEKLFRPGEPARGDIHQLHNDIRNYLNAKRCLIVLDDVNEQRWWDGIKSAFPEQTTSRIIVTTSFQTVAKACSSGNSHVHNMRTLEGKHSKELLKAVLKEQLPGLEQSSVSILNKCDGHPLALLTVANYLLSEDENTGRVCEQLCRSLGLRMATEAAFEELREVLMKSYRSLPSNYHNQRHLRNLKTCLLYLCVFPNGSHISGGRLMRRWFAEKYVQDEHPFSDLEVANDYFKKLVDPNIIWPVDSTKHEEVKMWRTHGIMREFMLHMSTYAKFITSHENKERSNYRHLFIQNTSRGRASDVGTSRARDSTSGDEKFRAHSLTICGSAGEAVADLAKCELLRVLDLEECNDLKDEHLDGIHELWHLRYLSLGDKISRVPREIRKLHCLETLDMRKTKKKIELPVKVIKLPHLAHLLGRFKLDKKKWGKQEKCDAKESNLQTLAGFVTDDKSVFPKLMIHMNKLRKVKIWCNSTGDDLLEAIKKFIQVGIDTSNGDRFLTLDLGRFSGDILRSLENSMKDSSGYLSSLKLYGALRGQTKFTTLLCGLRELCLISTNDLTTDDLFNLSKLKVLEYLKLVKVSLRGFTIRREDFRGLRRLCLVQSTTVPQIEEGALQNLVSLQLLSEHIGDLCGFQIRTHELLQEVVLDSGINQEAKMIWEAAAQNHPKRPRVLYLERVDPEGTGSKVKYVAIEGHAPDTECSIIHEEQQILAVRPISAETLSSALNDAYVAGPSMMPSSSFPSAMNNVMPSSSRVVS